MMSKFLLVFVLGWFLILSWPLLAQEGIHIRADNILYEEEEGRIEAWGKVSISWQGVSVETERMVFLLPELELFVPGPLEALLHANPVKGRSLYYSFFRKEGWIQDAELFYKVGEEGELLFRGQKIQYHQGEWRGDNLLLTGCHRTPPLYSLRAREVVILPENRLVMKGLGLYVRNQKILEIPGYSVSLRRGQGGFSPDFGYERKKGYYLRGRYEYPLGDFLVLVQAELASLQGFSWSMDLLFAASSWEVQVFGDFYRDRKETKGGYVRWHSGLASFWGIFVENEYAWIDDTLVAFSRRPQYVFSLEEEKDRGFSWEAHWSTGRFQEKDLILWREDLYLGAGWQDDSWGARVFFWNTSLESGEYLPRFGGSIWWEKEISSTFDFKLSYRFFDTPESPFSFDPQKEHFLSLEFLWGEERGSFVRVRGKYDLAVMGWDELTLGVGLGNQDFSLGAEGIYSFPRGEWTDRRYFVRKRIEDCMEMEASFWEPDQSFFLALNLVGLDAGKKKPKTLFDREDEFSFFAVERGGFR